MRSYQNVTKLHNRIADVFLFGDAEIHNNKLGQGRPTHWFLDPFAWRDSKRKSSYNQMKDHGERLEIHTASDLIARDDYIIQIPMGTTIHFYLMEPPRTGNSYNEWRMTAFPSNQRLKMAAKRLRASGKKLKVIVHRYKSFKQAERKIK